MKTMYTDSGAIRRVVTAPGGANNAFVKFIPVDANSCRVEIHYLLDSVTFSGDIPENDNVVYWENDETKNLLNGNIKSHFSAEDPATVFLNLQIQIDAIKTNHAQIFGRQFADFKSKQSYPVANNLTGQSDVLQQEPV
jgi:hypothetical protein